jgi:aurora kinase
MFVFPGVAFPGDINVTMTHKDPFIEGTFGKLFHAEAHCKGVIIKCVLKTVDCIAAKKMNEDMDASQEDDINKLLAQDGPHPNIIQCLSSICNDQFVHMLFEYASLGDLFEFIQTIGKALPFVQHVGLSLATGLKFCHDKEIIHRDIKPENILLFAVPDGPPQIKICDFGLAQHVKATDGWCRGVCGTIDFMPPEVHCDKIYTYNVDAWSFGIVLFHMATADMPFGEILSYKRKKQVQKISNILKNPHYDYSKNAFWRITDQRLRDLVSKLVTYWPQNRLNFSQILQHLFFKTPFVYNPADFEKPSPHSSF